mmetsp:Transcript_3003/g.8893  ORF Transcript_3003/g.8893 Transcript_3003/m.8893 type:complete len:218 (-) Transcript_3003:450-1103(-)
MPGAVGRGHRMPSLTPMRRAALTEGSVPRRGRRDEQERAPGMTASRRTASGMTGGQGRRAVTGLSRAPVPAGRPDPRGARGATVAGRRAVTSPPSRRRPRRPLARARTTHGAGNSCAAAWTPCPSSSRAARTAAGPQLRAGAARPARSAPRPRPRPRTRHRALSGRRGSTRAAPVTARRPRVTGRTARWTAPRRGTTELRQLAPWARPRGARLRSPP